jgi:ABC-type nitrate/sulfonate/bicarbonate transport system permease component
MDAAQGTSSTRASWAGAGPLIQGVGGLIGIAALLEAAPRTGLVSPLYFPPLSALLAVLADEVQLASFWTALGFTLESWALGLLISVTAGIAIGIAIGSSSTVLATTRSTIEFLRPIPSVALIPLVTLLFGTTLRSNLVLVVYAAFWQVLIQVLYGVQDVDPVARETARSYRFGRWAQIRYVTWPTTLPYLMTGVRLAAAVALILTITAELVIGTPGLGKEIFVAQTSGAYSVMYAYVIVTGIIGVAVNVLARALERLVMPWHPSLRAEVPA